MSYLVDTSVISELVRSSPNKKVLQWFEEVPDESLYICVLTLGEIRKGVEKIQEAPKREKLRLWLEYDIREWFGDRILNIDAHVADRWGIIQSHAKRPVPAIDSLIAATALQYHLSLVTRNVMDFNFPELNIINPWE